jgi:hypothetical protein
LVVCPTFEIHLWTMEATYTCGLTSRRSQQPIALAVPLRGRRVLFGCGSAFFVRPLMSRPSETVADAYIKLMEKAILQLRMRIRYGEIVSLDEIHDLLDAMHNIPAMLRGDSAWHNEENIIADLARYGEHWMSRAGSNQRVSLVQTLEVIRERKCDDVA